MEQLRWKSVPLWTAMASLVYLVARDWFGFEIPNWADISTTVITIGAILFGIANNPTNKDNF